MCGILGFIVNRTNGFNQNEIKAIHDMMYVTALRGTDSTGVFYVTNSGDVQTHKEIGESGKFLKTKEWEATDRELFRNGQAIVGHCRAGTRGAKTDDNAHPFIVGNKIILVHNGTYYGSHDHLAKTDVDSHAIAHVLAEEPDIAKALSKINAAYALVWYNNETRTLHAIRNKDRPLWLAMTEDGSMMFASESSFIYTAAWRNGVKIADTWPQMLGEHKLFTCHLDDMSKDYGWEDIDASYKAPPQVYKPPVQQSRTHTSVIPFHRGNSKSIPTLAEVAEKLNIGKFIPNLTGGDAGPWRSWCKQNQHIIVEATEYSLIDKASNLYYVYGDIIDQDERINGFAAGWEMTAGSEEEVVEYITRQFFDGKIEYGVGRNITTKGMEVETALFKLYAVEPAKMFPVDSGIIH